MTTHIDWFHEQHLTVLVTMLSSAMKITWDKDDFAAIYEGIKHTDYEDGKWFSLGNRSDETYTVSFAQDVGSSVIFFRVIASDSIINKVKLGHNIITSLYQDGLLTNR